MAVPDTCANCKFFYTKRSQCLRYPPTYAPGQVIAYKGRVEQYHFPPVAASDWCGEWRQGAGPMPAESPAPDAESKQ